MEHPEGTPPQTRPEPAEESTVSLSFTQALRERFGVVEMPTASSSGEPSSGPFSPGMLVAGRFRIEAEIAQGGMGVVYRATDEKLNQKRALKVAKIGYDTQLPPEARNALRVTHPNVCRVFEIHTTDTAEGSVDFLSMEFIEGGTLNQHLRANGPFAGAEALAIAEQICAGIAAAHAQNLLHRDLKTNNVLLARAEDGGLRAVVTDFGLAKDSALPPADAPEHTSLAGTPSYIAPERWEGKSSSVATDIFALGIVLHEIASGRRPGGERQEPRTIDPAIPARWRSVIGKCLDARPERRYASAAQVAEALSGRAAKRRRAWLAAAALVLALVATWKLLTPVTPPARLAILPFDAPGASPEVASLVRAAGFDLSSRLVRMRPRPPQLVVIPIESAQGISATGFATAKKKLGASYLLSASVIPSGSQLLLRGAIVNTSTGIAFRESSAEILSTSEISPRLATLVAEAFNLPRQAPAETIASAAWPDYGKGLNSLHTRRNYAEAIDAFEKAAALDPKSPLPRARLAEACSNAFEETGDVRWLDRGREELTRAAALNPDSLAVHLAAGALNRQPGSYQKAVEEFQRATQLDPNSAEAWNGLARSWQSVDGRNAEAAEAFLKAIQLQPDYFQPLHDFASFQRNLGNYGEAEKLFRRAVELAPSDAALHADLGGMYGDMGRYQDAEQELQKALDIDPGLRSVLNNLGAVYQYQGRDSEAIQLFERARSSGPESQILALNLGDSWRRLGKRAEAADAYRRGLKLAQALVLANPADAVDRAFAAYFILRLGNRAEADRELVQALHFGPKNRTVVRRAVLYYEAAGQREKSLELLQSATPDLIRELNRQPDVLSLRQDPRFMALLAAVR